MAAKLSVVAATGTKPARTLGNHGTILWRAIMAEYQIDDAGGVDRDGDIIRTKAGPRDHPGLKHELAARAFVVRTLAARS